MSVPALPGTRPRRLLYLVNDASFFASHRLPLARTAARAGHDVHVALPFAAVGLSADPHLDEIRTAGATLHPLALSRGGLAPHGEAALIRDLAALFRRLRPDLLHAITIKPVVYGGALARLLKVPAAVYAISGLGHVFIDRGARATLARNVASRGYRFALAHPNARVVFQNPQDRDLFHERRLVRDAASVLIPGCGVDVEAFHPAPAPPSGPPVVVLPARLQREKGVIEFVEAARRLKADGITARFALLGYADSDRPEGLSPADIHAWEAEGTVEWWGHSTEMPERLREAHIVCLPSYREGFPKAVIEAQACGLPVITSDVPGCRDAVRAGETALLVPPREAEALTAALKTLLTDSQRRVQMGAAGRRLVVEHFTVERFIEASFALYATLLERVP